MERKIKKNRRSDARGKERSSVEEAGKGWKTGINEIG